MSIKMMALVWDADLPKHEKFILLAYADHADNEGGNIFPANRTIARKTGYTHRQVQRIKGDLGEHREEYKAHPERGALLIFDHFGYNGQKVFSLQQENLYQIVFPGSFSAKKGGGVMVTPPPSNGGDMVTGGGDISDTALGKGGDMVTPEPFNRPLNLHTKDLTPDEQVWIDLIAKIKPDMALATFNTYVANQVAAEIQNGKLTVTAHNKETAQWLTERLTDSCTRQLTGLLNSKEATIKFIHHKLNGKE